MRNSPSKTWQVNCGWVLAANIAADMTAWNRLLGFHDCADLKEAEPDMLRYRVWHLPAGLVHHARQRILKIIAFLRHDRALWRLSRVQLIFGGTTEIMKEILGRGLDL